MYEGEQRAWVVFSGKTDLWWLRILKPGFRHCYLLIKDKGCWLSVDPLSNHMEIEIQPVPEDFDLPLHFRSLGMLVLPAPICRSHEKPAPIMAFSCVEAIKRILGIHRFFVWTPYQLYRAILKMNAAVEHRPDHMNSRGGYEMQFTRDF